jgi:hypothetical protein
VAEERKESASLAKPAEFFIGLVDFFAILLPGGLATAICLQLAAENGYPIGQNKSIFNWLNTDPHWPVWVAFAVASYLLGHFIFLLGSASLDNLYDLTYKVVLKDESAILQEASERLLKTALGMPIQSTYQWARMFARLRNPATALEIDRLEADSKFFRSLTILLFLTGYLIPAALCQKTGWRIEAVAVVSLCFTGAVVLGNWQRLHKLTVKQQVRGKAYARYMDRCIHPYENSNDSDIDDWLEAEKKILLPRRCCAWGIMIAAVFLQLSFYSCFETWHWFWLQSASIVCLLLSGWRYMERRFKSVAFTYRLLLASSSTTSG